MPAARNSRRRPASNSPEGPPSSRARRDEDTELATVFGRRVEKPRGVARSVLATITPSENALPVTAVDYHLKSNRENHHTNEYELPDLIVRRGQKFHLSITFDRDYDANAHEIILQFSVGDEPLESNGTLTRIPLTSKSSSDWEAKVDTVKGDTIDVTVVPPADAIVGRYSLGVETRVDKAEDGNYKVSRKTITDPIYVLFNAWCKDDTVYMENDAERQEYVLNENGAIWTGNRRRFGPRPWTFGQFEDICIEAVFYLLEKAELDVQVWGNPIKVLRTLSAMSNSMDENGVLEGRWTSTYPEGTTVPWKWTGSIAIIEQFMKTKKPVKYGQCWVFSGLTTTLCRAVGIPTRSVTNFESAHDSDESMTIDTYWKADDSKDEDGSDDSVWNFHVWNESWLKRQDLPSGYDGWQAHDATPQESSEGVMRCGPAPLKAIKEGHVYFNYDIPFVFAEVNGDKLHWQVQKDGSMNCVDIEKNAVGHFISTKAPGRGNERLDVTNLYKYPEGSEDERRVAASVFRHSKLRKKFDVYDSNVKKDVTFREDIPSAAKHGQNFELPVHMTNTSSEVRSVRVKISAIASFYTGVTSERIKSIEFLNVNLQPGASESVTLPVETDEYLTKLVSGDFIKIFVTAHVKETSQRYIHSESMSLAKPLLYIEAPDDVKHRTPFTLKVKYTNSLGRDLNNAVFNVSAAGIVRNLDIPAGNVASGETIERETTLTPTRTGLRDIVVTFEADGLHDIVGDKEVMVLSE